ncbi:diguanylate cyclase/phosphodiesterase with PAS/PAC sensor [Geminocystis sp. NIES-3708]|uniref:EAL domain-containing protein n=1 Tax=Geminocystis sp. NIES-3708 TaxID=1615909 RepID=UPI0005FC8A49|nr:EAL domain-containing protein [Geminocystis sp. NIES-3708]BAQ60475.1 diguanylate cyclase/phosphodiesterase with PAS/PAC sensor [Geminocystis sp. NIES-3708]
MILDIRTWVLRTVCQQNQRWLSAGFPELCVAVNLSGKHFQQENLADEIRGILQETKLKPHQLELEITEGLLIDDVQKAINILQQLHNYGFLLALDDFGTGFSSLSYLKRFSLDFLKIDQSFVKGIPHDSDDSAITCSVIALAHSLQMSVIAEGVETIEQANYLQDHGCYKLQGYYFSRPIPAQDFTHLWQEKLKKYN